MATLMEVRKGRMHSLGEIPSHLVGKVTTADELKAAAAADTRRKEAAAKQARRQQEAAETGAKLPEEITSLSGDALAARYEDAFGRKPGNRTEDTQRQELAEAAAADGEPAVPEGGGE